MLIFLKTRHIIIVSLHRSNTLTTSFHLSFSRITERLYSLQPLFLSTRSTTGPPHGPHTPVVFPSPQATKRRIEEEPTVAEGPDTKRRRQQIPSLSAEAVMPGVEADIPGFRVGHVVTPQGMTVDASTLIRLLASSLESMGC